MRLGLCVEPRRTMSEPVAALSDVERCRRVAKDVHDYATLGADFDSVTEHCLTLISSSTCWHPSLVEAAPIAEMDGPLPAVNLRAAGWLALVSGEQHQHRVTERNSTNAWSYPNARFTTYTRGPLGRQASHRLWRWGG